MEKAEKQTISKYTYFWDIETSTITTDCNYELQVTYLSNVVKMNCESGEIVSSKFFRTISETVDYFNTLECCIVWVHNLDYELTFLLRDTQTKEINDEQSKPILRDKNAPLSVVLEILPHITFRDTYALFNKSVKKLGEEINFKKLDYDYKKLRLPWDNLEKLDYEYNERDNLIVAKSLYKYMVDNNLSVDDIPLTFTSSVRRARKEYIKNNFGKKALLKFYYDRNESFTSFLETEELMKVYQGGLTCSNMLETGKVITNEKTSGVIGIDIKSSYPFQMCTRKFPVFTRNETYYSDIANKIFLSKEYKGFIGVFTFKNIIVKNKKFLLPISSSQISKGSVSSDKKLFNGKLISASELTIPCTNIDLDVIQLIYKFDEIVCEKITIAKKERYLRREEVSFLLSNFINKETKSGDIKEKSKLIINSMYGVKVSNPIKDEYFIDEGKVEVNKYFDCPIKEREIKYNNYVNSLNLNSGGLDVYSDGVFITSYARKQLIEMVVYIVENGGNVVYSDTDSIKFYCKNKKELDILLSKILHKNENRIKANLELPRFNFFINKFEVNNIEKEAISKLGIWEVEDKEPHKIFMTYGAKKYGYITYDNKVKTTIAGCNKKNIPIVIENVAKVNNMSLKEAFIFVFSPSTTFDETASGRTTAKKEKCDYVEMLNMTYNGKKLNQFGGIVIKDTTYTLNITINDSEIIGFNENELITVKINIKGEVEFE